MEHALKMARMYGEQIAQLEDAELDDDRHRIMVASANFRRQFSRTEFAKPINAAYYDGYIGWVIGE